MPKSNPIAYYGKKILVFLLSVLVLSIVVFYVARLAPGDPLVSYYGERTEKMSPKEREWALKKLGLNEPIHVQYIKWLGQAFHGNFGISFTGCFEGNPRKNCKYSSAGRDWISFHFCRFPSAGNFLCVEGRQME